LIKSTQIRAIENASIFTRSILLIRRKSLHMTLICWLNLLTMCTVSPYDYSNGERHVAHIIEREHKLIFLIIWEHKLIFSVTCRNTLQPLITITYHYSSRSRLRTMQDDHDTTVGIQVGYTSTTSTVSPKNNCE
jgi:hypothetical protein